LIAGKAPLRFMSPTLRLSTAHIPPPASLTVPLNGSVLILHERLLITDQRGGGSRGTITDFSKQSRKRLKQKMGMIDRDWLVDRSLFVSLSYPGDRDPSPAVAKSHLENYLKRLQRRFPSIACVWRMEYQRRGVIHFHMLLLGYQFIDMDKLKILWQDVVGCLDRDFYEHGCWVEKPRTLNGIQHYVSKYLAKKADPLPTDAPGRLWGVKGRRNIPAASFHHSLTWEQMVNAGIGMRKVMADRGWVPQGPGWCWSTWGYFGPEEVFEILDRAGINFDGVIVKHGI
jgi:hypothetical protein